MKQSDKLRQNIRDTREQKKLTQEELAEKLGLSVTGYAKIERGETQINYDRLEKIAKALEVGVGELIPLQEDEGIIVLHNLNNNLRNSNTVIALTDKGLESEILRLRQMLADKEEIIKVKEQENESLCQQIRQQEKIIMWGGGYFCTGMTGGKKRRKTLSGADLSEAGARKNLHQLLL